MNHRTIGLKILQMSISGHHYYRRVEWQGAESGRRRRDHAGVGRKVHSSRGDRRRGRVLGRFEHGGIQAHRGGKTVGLHFVNEHKCRPLLRSKYGYDISLRVAFDMLIWHYMRTV